jgi:hypothetical protein
MKSRSVAALVLAMGVSLVTPASASSACKPLVTDPAGDANEPDLPVPIYQRDLDILAVDLTSNVRTLTLTVRMAKVETTPAPSRLIDITLPLSANPDSHVYDAYLYVGPDKTQFTFQDDRWHVANVPGTMNVATGTIRFQIPRSLISRGVRRFQNIDAWATLLIGTNENAEGVDFDEARSTRTYALGTRGCL